MNNLPNVKINKNRNNHEVKKFNIPKGGVDNMRKYSFQKGFTLIELLIVIVVIGVLAGVLLTVINPAQQIAKARDATTKATLTKIAYAIKSNRNAIGFLPKPDDVRTGNLITGVTATAASQCGNTTTGGYCTFRLAGSSLPATCSKSTEYNGTGAIQCRFYYLVPTDKFSLSGPNFTGQDFRLLAKSYNGAYTIIYISTANYERMYICPDDFDVALTYPFTAGSISACVLAS